MKKNKKFIIFKKSKAKLMLIVEQIRENIENEMKRQNMTVRQLEEKAGVTRGIVKAFLEKRSLNPTFETIYRVSEALCCSLDQLLGLEKFNKEIINLNTRWYKPLFLKSTEYAHDFIRRYKKNTSAENVIHLVTELYLYSAKENLDKIDDKFAKWWLEKFLS
jgi:transcriptional regulator with XRE-family HTH domain